MMSAGSKKKFTALSAAAQDPDNVVVDPNETQMTRRRLGDQAQPNYLWLVTFTDVMGLILTFFVMLFSMSSPETAKFSQVATVLQGELNSAQGPQMNRGTEEVINLSRIDYGQALNVRYLEELMKAAVEQNPALKNMELIPQPGSLVVSLPQELLFEPGQAEIKEAGRKALYTLGGTLSKIRNRIEISGHADPRPLEGASSGTYTSNWELSLGRAAAVAAILENVGYEQSITIAGFGSGRYQDLAGIEDETERHNLARRVDIVIMNHSSKKEKVSDFPVVP